jgi:hypothetical protein
VRKSAPDLRTLTRLLFMPATLAVAALDLTDNRRVKDEIAIMERN